jgi:hypothetical protein
MPDSSPSHIVHTTTHWAHIHSRTPGPTQFPSPAGPAHVQEVCSSTYPLALHPFPTRIAHSDAGVAQYGTGHLNCQDDRFGNGSGRGLELGGHQEGSAGDNSNQRSQSYGLSLESGESTKAAVSQDLKLDPRPPRR